MPTNFDDAQPFTFISHASKDNDRFALPLEAALRARGVRTFFDQRDILVGQNFVDRIFDYGIGTANFVIIILSNNTKESAFVHKEMTTAVVASISGSIKALLPVLLDGIEPPVALLDINHVRGDETTVPAVADALRDAIFGKAEPIIAPPPAYIDIPVHRFPGLEPDDERVFTFAANLYLDAPRWHPSVDTRDILRVASNYGMSDEVVLESFEILEHQHYVAEQHWELGTRVPYAISLSSFGLQRFLQSYRPLEWRRAARNIVAAVVNGGVALEPIIRSHDIAEALAITILADLKIEGLLSYDTYSQGTFITGTPMLKRWLKDMQ